MIGGFLGILVCGAVAVVLIGFALKDGAAVRRLRRHGIRTHGVVVDNVRIDERNGPQWAPVIAFADQRGYRVEFTTRIRGVGMGLATGREVPVVYLPQNPQLARVRMWRHMVGPALFALFAGLAFLGFAVLIVLVG